MKINIDIENREINKKNVECYIPKINGVPVMGTGYIIKDSINSDGKKTDNLDLAKSILNRKVDGINKFLEVNYKFLDKKEIKYTQKDLEEAFEAGRKQYSRLTWSDEFVDDFTYNSFKEWFEKFKTNQENKI